MDYEKYYAKRRDQSYIVHFANGKGLSLSEVKEIFSTFGEVLSVDNRGQTHGLCFVRYKNIEDVKRCIEGAQSYKNIKILPHKYKLKDSNMQSSQHNGQRKTFQQDSFKDDSNCASQKTSYKKRLEKNETNSQFNTNGSKSYIKNKDTLSEGEGAIDSENCSDISIISSKRSDNVSHCSVNRILSAITNNTSKRFEDMLEEREIPPLVSIDQCSTGSIKHSSPSLKIILAQEVIVANIHPSSSIHYILHLFEKHNPISVTLMMTTPKTAIRYCYVYYKTYADAYATVKEFDGYSLYGKNLIVLTSQRLIKEAS